MTTRDKVIEQALKWAEDPQDPSRQEALADACKLLSSPMSHETVARRMDKVRMLLTDMESKVYRNLPEAVAACYVEIMGILKGLMEEA